MASEIDFRKKDYKSWTVEVFGQEVAAPGVLLAANFGSSSEWGKKMHDAMFRVEIEYVDALLTELRESRVAGDIVEFGIFQGWWINWLYERTEFLNMTDRAIIGYDSFQGLSEPDPARDGSFWKAGMYAVSKSDVEQRVQAQTRPRIKLIEGWFADSLKQHAALAVDQIAYARIDCDIYEPALQCLDYLSTRLADGAILIFDDWPHMINHGEGLAFAEWVSTVPWYRFEFIFYGSWGHLYLRVRKR